MDSERGKFDAIAVPNAVHVRDPVQHRTQGDEALWQVQKPHLVPYPFDTSPVNMVATTALREALNHGISSGNFVDTKIILYSSRDPSGRVRRPKALYANSHVLMTVPYFDIRESIVVLNVTRAETF